MKRLFLWINLLAALVLLLTACGGVGMSSPTPEPAKLTFAAPNEYKDYYTARIADFQKQNPQITIDLVSSNSSSTADISVLRWDEIFSNGGDRLSKALDISPFLEQSKTFNRADYYNGTLEPFTRDGKLKGLPTGVDPFVMLYNRDLFDRYHVPYPKAGWSWDDFKTAAMQLRDPAHQVYGYASTLNYIDSLFFVYQHGGNLLPSGNSTPQLDSPEAIEALDWYSNLYTTSNVAPTKSQASQDFGGDVSNGILNGKVAMWMNSVSAMRPPSDKGWPFNLGIVPLPHDVTSFSVAQFEGLMISANTKSPTASWKFVAFLNDQPLPWMIPARQALASSPAYASSIGKDQAEAAMAAMKDASLISSFDFRSLNNVINIFSVATSAAVEGNATAAEALHAAQKKIQ